VTTVLLERRAWAMRMETIHKEGRLRLLVDNPTVGDVQQALDESGTFVTFRVAGFPDVRVRLGEDERLSVDVLGRTAKMLLILEDT
jgi:hypothetical protein